MMLDQYYKTHLDTIESLIMEEISHWQWDAIPQVKNMIVEQLGRKGKRLRPLLMLIFADLHCGQIERIHRAAAAIEVYHTTTLIYDDIQDNSEFRRGLPCAHVTASTSTAMNLAGIVRTFVYHLLHRSTLLNEGEKLKVHQRFDQAATLVALGQSIDIGWHEGWYSSYRSFPYESMIRWKSATLFGCAAAIGTLLAECDSEAISQAEEVGIEIGLLFQRIDDYLDVFGDPVIMRRPLYNDFREGKITLPIICLFDQLTQQRSKSNADKVNYILHRLAERNIREANWQWLVDLMLEYKVDSYLQRAFKEQIASVLASIENIGTNALVRQNLRVFIEFLASAVLAQGN